MQVKQFPKLTILINQGESGLMVRVWGRQSRSGLDVLRGLGRSAGGESNVLKERNKVGMRYREREEAGRKCGKEELGYARATCMNGRKSCLNG